MLFRSVVGADIVRHLHLERAKAALAVQDEIHLVARGRAPVVQAVTQAAVIVERACLLQKQRLQRRPMNLLWRIQRTARADGLEHAGVEIIEFRVRNQAALGAFGEDRQPHGPNRKKLCCGGGWSKRGYMSLF